MFYFRYTMKIVISLLCISVLIVAIGTAPVVETGGKNARQNDPKDDKESDDIVWKKPNFSRY